MLVVLQEHCLDLDQLLGPGLYKERYRADMILWGENRRRQDPGFFCRLATRGARQPVWVVSDARRLSDLQWFWSEFPRQTQSVRVQSSEETRKQRGWSFSAGKIPRLSVYLYVCRSARLCSPVCLSGVDDAESECGLDSGVDFDWIVTNETDAPSLEEQLQPIMKLAEDAASSSLCHGSINVLVTDECGADQFI
ncbi:phosphomevalonate kinase isoform X1 [Anarrhichthys ocellatus]|uniref:phosphomevalonate kinase isoform X1 n=1 Tax=Anarrhichthys ocellatus TaxID=433405 RepID=UPI0012ECFEE8|nr:phosphomevalonate kinase isoform X1 [Anarrhichthys ocellatus]